MALTLTRKCVIKNVVVKLKKKLNITAYPCTSIFLSRQNYGQFFQRQSICEMNIPVLCLPKHVDIVNVSYYSTQCKKDDNNADKKEEKLSLFQKFKIMYRDYWYVLVPVHLVTSAIWFGMFYYMAKCGIDIIKVLESLHVSERFINPLRDSSMGYFAVAYALYKVSTPARYTVTLGGTTISINYLKKWGYIKPVPSKERMKEIIQEKTETLSKSVKDTREGIIEKKTNIMETVRETKEGIIEKKQNIIESLHDAKEEIIDKKGHILGNIKDNKKKIESHKKGDKISRIDDRKK